MRRPVSDQAGIDRVDPHAMRCADVCRCLGKSSAAALIDPPMVNAAAHCAGADANDIGDAAVSFPRMGPGGACHTHVAMELQCEPVPPVRFGQGEKATRLVAPALLTSESRRPNCATAAAAARSVAAGSRRSAAQATSSRFALLLGLPATAQFGLVMRDLVRSRAAGQGSMPALARSVATAAPNAANRAGYDYDFIVKSELHSASSIFYVCMIVCMKSW